MKKKVTCLLSVLTVTITTTSVFNTAPVYAENYSELESVGEVLSMTETVQDEGAAQSITEVIQEDTGTQNTSETGRKETDIQAYDTDAKTENDSNSTTDSQEADAKTQQLLEEYYQLLSKVNLFNFSSYEDELANFPADYQSLLQQLHTAHPNWVFVAVDTGLDWNTVVEMESRSGLASDACYSLLPSFAGRLLLSKASTDYDAATGTYIVKDGSEWVSASKAAVAYYMDPRNFLTEENMFQFEAFSYNETFHTLAGVEAALKGTDLYNRNISYVNTAGEQVTVALTYGEAILAAGMKYGISPILLASKIRQETSGSLSNGSISGMYSYGGVSYQGYYNFYNIGANGISADQGSAIANGLIFAKGGSSAADTSYGRPWTSPLLSIDGGAQYMTDSYLRRGQNTIYFKKFNTVAQPYYANQYMQNLYGAESEGRITYNAYKDNGILDNGYVFYIPVYQNMPAYQSEVTIEKNITTGQTTDELSLRTGPSTAYPILTKIPSGATITVNGGVYTDHTVSIKKRLYDPYWMRVTYGSYTGYSSAEFIIMHAGTKLPIGETKQLNVSCSDSVIYYETSNPQIATVSSTGLVTATGVGYCTIYAINQSGTRVDSVGIRGIEKEEVHLTAPVLASAGNGTQGVNISWNSVQGAAGYYIYRKTADSAWKSIGSVSGGSTVNYTDTTTQSGTTYTYTVKAYKDSTVSSYDTTGVSVKYLSAPIVSGVSNSKAGMKVTWNEVNGADGYWIFRKTGNGSWRKAGYVEGGNQTSFIDQGAQAGSDYMYTVRACSGSLMSAYIASSGTYRRLEEPKITTLANGVQGVTIKWSQVEGATGYYVFRKTGNGAWKNLKTIQSGSTIQFGDTTAVSGTDYIYTVRAFYGSFRSSYDAAGKALRYLSKPVLTSAANGTQGVVVKWNKVTGAEGYYIYRKTSESGWKNIGSIGSGSTVSFTDKTVASGVDYTYTVRAYSGSTKSGYDAAGKSVKYLSKPVLSGAVNSSSGITVTWGKVTGAANYYVYRKTDGGSWKRIATVGSGTVSYLDKNVQSGTAYTYTVRAYAGGVLSAYDSAGKRVVR